MTGDDERRISLILKRAIDAAKDSIGARLKLFFAMGKAMRNLGDVIKNPAPKGNRNGIVVNGISYSKAIQTVRDYLKKFQDEYGYELPTCDRYWFAALHAEFEFSHKEHEILLERNVSWAKVCDILAEPDRGHSLINELKHGRPLPTRRQFKIKARERAHRENVIDMIDNKSITVPLPQEPNDDNFYAGIKSLLSQVKQSHLANALNLAVRDLKKNRYDESLRFFELK